MYQWSSIGANGIVHPLDNGIIYSCHNGPIYFCASWANNQCTSGWSIHEEMSPYVMLHTRPNMESLQRSIVKHCPILAPHLRLLTIFCSLCTHLNLKGLGGLEGRESLPSAQLMGAISFVAGLTAHLVSWHSSSPSWPSWSSASSRLWASQAGVSGKRLRYLGLTHG